jgi:hypothetical protein
MLLLFVHQHASLEWQEAKRVLPPSGIERDPVRTAAAVRGQAAMNDTILFLIILGIVVFVGLGLRGIWRRFRDR